MKAALFSIRPEWCMKIAIGEKTVEVRKTAPKLRMTGISGRQSLSRSPDMRVSRKPISVRARNRPRRRSAADRTRSRLKVGLRHERKVETLPVLRRKAAHGAELFGAEICHVFGVRSLHVGKGHRRLAD